MGLIDFGSRFVIKVADSVVVGESSRLREDASLVGGCISWRVGADGRDVWGMKHGMHGGLRGLWMDRYWLLNLVRLNGWIEICGDAA